MLPRLLLAAVLLLPAAAFGQDLVTLEGVGPGSYVLTIGADGSTSLRPTRIVRVGTSPPPTNPQPPTTPLNPFARQISTEAKAVISQGGDPTTAVGLSEVYGIVSSRVDMGEIAPANALTATAAGTSAWMVSRSDRDKWQGFRDGLTSTFAEMQQKGELGTKEQYHRTLLDVSLGLADAAGYTPELQDRVGDQNASQPFLGGINLQEIIAFIVEFINLLKTLGIIK